MKKFTPCIKKKDFNLIAFKKIMKQKIWIAKFWKETGAILL